MTNTTTADILALPLPMPATELKVGDLAVFTDYAGRKIGCRVTRMEHGLVWCKVTGLDDWQGPYRRGDVMAIDADKVQGAI